MNASHQSHKIKKKKLWRNFRTLKQDNAALKEQSLLQKQALLFNEPCINLSMARHSKCADGLFNIKKSNTND